MDNGQNHRGADVWLRHRERYREAGRTQGSDVSGGGANVSRNTDLLVKLLEGRNIAPSAIARVIISDYLPATQVHIKRLAATEMTAGELRGLFERVKGGNRLVEADHEFLNKYFGSDWRQIIPGPSPSENATIALLAAGEGAVHEVQNGAIKVIEKLQPELKAEAEAAQQTLQEEQKVADALNGAKTDPNPPIVEQPNTPVRGPPVVERPLTSKFGAPIEGVAPPPPPAPRRLPTPPRHRNIRRALNVYCPKRYARQKNWAIISSIRRCAKLRKQPKRCSH